MSKFTKGPWVSGYGKGITGPTTPTLHGPCCAGENYPYDVVSKGTETIAIIPRPCSMDGEMKANTNLIAAAPEMYEALFELDKYMDFGENVSDNTAFTFEDASGINKAFRMCREAIIKARGEVNE